jgi:hypothetical protein
MDNLGRNKSKREHGDVVFLSEGLWGFGDLFCGLTADGGHTLETEGLAVRLLCFYDAVGVVAWWNRRRPSISQMRVPMPAALSGLDAGARADAPCAP